MTIEQFQELELSFIHDLKQSEPYLSCKKLSSQLEENEEIISLVKERDSLLLQAEKTEDSKEKAEVLKQYLKKQEEIDKIVQPFYRVDKARSREQGGVGLGVTLCQQIAEYHGGTLHYESELGVGTKVTMSWKNDFTS